MGDQGGVNPTRVVPLTKVISLSCSQMVPSEHSLSREVGVGWGKRKEPFLKKVMASVFNFKTHIGGSGFDLVVGFLPSLCWALT